MKEITIAPEGGTASCGIVGYMPGDAAVLLDSDLEDGRTRLFLRDLSTGAVTKPVPELDAWELDGAGLNETRQFLVTASNEDGYGVLGVFTVPGFERVHSPEADRGVLFPSNFRGTSLVWSLNNARTPGGAYVTTYSAEKPGEKPSTHQITWADDQGLDLAGFPLPELVKYRTFDDREIPAFLFLPAGYQKGTRIPFIVNYHGGPESQHRPTYSSQNQYFLSQGFGILMPNVRGSTGYGREFHRLDDYKNRWDSVKDGVEAAEWLVERGYAEPGRIATYGGSYGGFMSVACIVEDQERVDRGERSQRVFGASVNIVGITNLKTFLEKTSGYRQKLREVEYGPLTDVEFLESVSAMNRIDKIQVPMFIAHGFNDPRVPVEEAMQIAAALRERKQNPTMFIAPDEGHGFAKLDNRIYYGERVTAFLEETIGEGRRETPTP
jgi:dipeptidyl aminopeptidase/acylaminoacyl peptidase